MGEPGQVLGRAETVEPTGGQVPDAGREAQPYEIEGGEEGQGLAGGIHGVLGDGQVGRVAEDLVEGKGPFEHGGGDDLGAVGGVLVGDMGEGGGAFMGSGVNVPKRNETLLLTVSGHGVALGDERAGQRPCCPSLGLPLSVRPTGSQGTLPAVVGSPPCWWKRDLGFRTPLGRVSGSPEAFGCL